MFSKTFEAVPVPGLSVGSDIDGPWRLARACPASERASRCASAGSACVALHIVSLGFRVVLPPSCFSAALGMYSGQDVA